MHMEKLDPAKQKARLAAAYAEVNHKLLICETSERRLQGVSDTVYICRMMSTDKVSERSTLANMLMIKRSSRYRQH